MLNKNKLFISLLAGQMLTGIWAYSSDRILEDEDLEQRARVVLQANADVLYNRGEAYEEGRGVGQDYDVAREWYIKAASQNHVPAQYRLGLMYDVEKNYEEAHFWYRMAAFQGHASAQYSLGIMHEIGKGITQDHKRAINWYRMATLQNHPLAKQNLDNFKIKSNPEGASGNK